MKHRPPLTILALTAIAISILYAPQPLLPVLTTPFDVTETQAAMLMTLSMLPLGLAPLFYGYLLEGISARHMLITATVILAIMQLAMSLSQSWHLLILSRAVQGLCIPAMLTALMTTMTTACRHEHVRHAAAWYVAATIVGGFAGRAMTGLIAEYSNWRIALGIWGLMLLLALVGMRRIPYDTTTGFQKVRFSVFIRVLKIPGVHHAYIAIFCVFFVFAAILNVLPFHLVRHNPDIGIDVVGMIYSGYIAGFITAMNATRIHALLGNEIRSLYLGMALFSTGLLIFIPHNLASNFTAMFVFCGGMFLVHTSLSGLVNHLGEHHKGIVNGNYIASYYLGGTAGTWLPTLVYSHYDWHTFLLVLAAFILIAIWHIIHLYIKAIKMEAVH